jgi:hypothetical protein
MTATSRSAPMYSAEVWPRVPRSRASARASAGSAQAPAPAPAAIIAGSRSARPTPTDCEIESTRLAAAHATPGQRAPTTAISRRVGTPASAACQAPAAPPSAAAANTISEPAPTCATSGANGSSSANRPRTNTSNASSAAATPAPVARSTGQAPADRTACMCGDANERSGGAREARGPTCSWVLPPVRPTPTQWSAGSARRAMTRSKAATTAGSNWVPAQRRSSARASASENLVP